METELHENLRTLADAYQAVSGLPRTQVAKLAFKDPHFFKRLVETPTASFTVKKYDAAVGWFSDNWPDGAEWPEGVTRPDRTEPAAAAAQSEASAA